MKKKKKKKFPDLPVLFYGLCPPEHKVICQTWSCVSTAYNAARETVLADHDEAGSFWSVTKIPVQEAFSMKADSEHW